MARNRVTSTGYNFTNGTRDITVTDPLFADFTLESIRLIINETQKVVYFSSMNKTNATVLGNVITLDSSFPPLVTGDEITLEMDMGFVGADAVAVEINQAKTTLAQSITSKGVPSTNLDSFQQMADKIEDIVGDIVTTPIPTNNPSWHDLAYEIGQYVDLDNPFAFAILLNPTVESIELTGANAYKISDGRIFTSDQTITFGANEAGRELLQTKYVIYRKSSPYMTQNFGSYTPSLVRKILGAYNKNMDWSTISFNSVRIGFAINDTELTNPIIFGPDRKTLALQASQFLNNSGLGSFVFPPFHPSATDAEKVLEIPSSFMQTPTGLTSIGWPIGLKELTVNISAFSAAQNLTSLVFPIGLETLNIGQLSFSGNGSMTSLTFPSGLQTLNIFGYGAFSGNSNIESITFPIGLQILRITATNVFQNSIKITSIIFPTGLQELNLSGGNLFLSTTLLTTLFISKPTTILNTNGILSAAYLTSIELESNWNWTVSLTLANLTALNTKTLMLDKLVDKRFDGVNPSTVTSNSSSRIVTDTNGNGNFLELFRVGDTINIAGGGNRTIASIESRNQLTLTADAPTTGTDQVYNMNKTLTLNAAVKSRLATDYGANWADEYTAKGWTIA